MTGAGKIDIQQTPAQRIVSKAMAPSKNWIFKYIALLFVLLETSSALDCPVGWDTFGRFCYKFIPRSLHVRGLDWEDARSLCVGYGADLVSVGDKTEMDFIYNATSKIRNERYWIGLLYMPREKSFLWSDGTIYNGTVYNNWHSGEPRDPSELDCVELYHARWKTGNCQNEYGYICKRPKGLAIPSSTPPLPTIKTSTLECPAGWVAYSSSCYKLGDTPRKWIDAKKDCRSSGGYLVKIDDADEQHFISIKLRTSSNNAWIGLSDSALEGTFIWEGDNSLVKYKNWDDGAPNNFGGVEDCVEVLSGLNAGFWNDDYCDSEKHYICEMPYGLSLCPANWRMFGDSCYQFNVHGSQARPWARARETCSDFEGSDLISFAIEEEQMFIFKELSDMSIDQVWIGLNDRKNEGAFEWSDRSAVKYVNWGVNESSVDSSQATDNDCVVLDPNTDNGTWAVTSCSLNKGYICERERGINLCHSPLGMENGNIGDSQITASSSRNRASSPENARLRRSPEDSSSNAWCAGQSKVGEFLQIDLGRVCQVTHISLQGRPGFTEYVKTFYIKYGDNGDDFITYGENATIQYKVLQGNVDSKSVKNILLPEPIHARVVRIYPLTWSSEICLRTEIYGCLSQAYSEKCGIGWEEGLNYTCYQINSNEWKLWADARATCVSRGGELLSVFNAEEKNWLKYRLKKLSGWAYSFWLGLNTRDQDFHWCWSDGSPLRLIAWDVEFSENQDGDNHCFEVISSSGIWRSVSCGVFRPFICKRKLQTRNPIKSLSTGNWISGTDYYWPLDRVVDGKALGTVLAKVVGNVNVADVKQNGRNVFHYSAYQAYLDAGQFTGECITDPDQCFYGITVSFVVRFEDAAKGWTSSTFIVDTVGDRLQQNNRGFTVYVVNSKLYVTVFGEKFKWSSIETLKVGIWQHILFSWNREDGLAVYIDGLKSSSMTSQTTLSPRHSANNPLLIIGSKSGEPRDGGFYMRSLAVWKRQLTAQEANNVYLAEFGVCRSGWQSFGQYCYQFNSEPKTWSEARLSCVNQQAELVSIHSPVEQAYMSVASRAPELKMRDQWIWIGLHATITKNQFEWSDGSPVQYTNWRQLKPSRADEQSVCAYLLYTRPWDAYGCSRKLPYICKKLRDYTPQVENNSVTAPYPMGDPKCPEGWRHVTKWTRCFGLMFDRKNWTEARDACRAYGADLASFEDEMDSVLLTSLLVNSWDVADVGGLWIGLSDTTQQRKYQWSDGSPVRYTSWLSGEPDQPIPAGNCVRAILQGGQAAMLFWQNSDCSERLPYACTRAASDAPQPISVIPANKTFKWCAPGWMANGSLCYGMVLEQKTWPVAIKHCRSLGGDLVSVHSLEENRFITSLFNESVFAAWLGMSGRGVFSGYTWSDGTSVQFTSWGPQQPDSHYGQQPCVEMYSTGEWADTGCYSTKPFICKALRPYWIRTEPPPTKTTFSVTTQAPDICPPKWTLWNSMCYFFGGDGHETSWQSARVLCSLTRGGNLVSIGSAAENDFIWRSIPKELRIRVGDRPSYDRRRFWLPFPLRKRYHWVHRHAWIGLNDLTEESNFRWTDGSPLKYTNYELGEPNDYGGGEDCVEMNGSGKWNDNSCEQRKAYVCKTHNDSVLTLEPTRFPANVSTRWTCREGWTNYGRSCYRAVFSDTESWIDARVECMRGTNSTMRSDLVIIDNQYEQAFLRVLTIGPTQSLWIGMIKFRWEKWVNNKHVKYSKWDSTLDPIPHHSLRCFAMTSSGKWTNADCSTRLGFICEAGAIQVPSKTNSTPVSSSNRTCPEPYEKFGQDCYFVSHVNLTWYEARESCFRESEGELLSIHNSLEQAFVNLKLQNIKSLWLGFFARTNSTEFFWTDHSLRTFTNWVPHHPKVPQTKPACAVALNASNDAGRWVDADCSERHGFACRIRKGEPHISPPLLGTCPDGWLKFDKGCYMFKERTYQRWTTAFYTCKREGGELVSITSRDEQDFINFQKLSKKAVWIGLNDRAIEGVYSWSDGSPVSFLNWKQEPSIDSTLVKNCVIMDETGVWDNRECSLRYGYICKRQLECTEALGMISGDITDSQITATSSIDSEHGPAMARLFASSAWCTNRSQSKNHIQIDLLTESRVIGIHTQGFHLDGNDSYVQLFQLQTSDDAVTWTTYQKYGKAWVFVVHHAVGMVDAVAKIFLSPPVVTRFVRLITFTRINSACLRMELYGCRFACQTPLGMESGEIEDKFFSASSFIDTSHSASQARPFGSSWAAKKSDTEPWLEINFPAEEWKITKITTWGGGQKDEYVKVYRLAYKDEDTQWTDYKEGGRIRNFRGNQDAINPQTHLLAEPIITQYFRLKPLTWAASGAYLRLELFGCHHGCDSALGLRQGTIVDSALSASSSFDQEHAAAGGRLNGSTGWCANDKDTKPYLMIDLGQVMKIRKVVVQGAADDKGSVKTFAISFKEDTSKSWLQAFEQGGKPKVFIANMEGSTTVTNTLPSALRARFIKVLPMTWNTRACLRLELYGCLLVAPEPAEVPTSALPSANALPSKDVNYTGSLTLSSEQWTDDLKDPKSQVFKNLADRLENEITKLYSGVGEPSLAFKRVEVTDFRPGSVIAEFILTFYRDMENDPGVNVTAKLAHAVRGGKLGDMSVDPYSLRISKTVPGQQPTTAATVMEPAASGRNRDSKSTGLSTGAKAGITTVVLVVLLVVCVAAFIWWFRRHRKEFGFRYMYKYCTRPVSYSSKTEETELL